MDHIKVPATLAKARGVNAYSDAGEKLKATFHQKGRVLLLDLAAALGDVIGSYTVRNNQGGIAVSGEVTLHADHLYVQLSEMVVGNGALTMMYRSCSSQKDYCGDQNHFVSLAQFAEPDVQARVLSTMRSLIQAKREALSAANH